MLEQRLKPAGLAPKPGVELAMHSINSSPQLVFFGPFGPQFAL